MKSFIYSTYHDHEYHVSPERYSTRLKLETAVGKIFRLHYGALFINHEREHLDRRNSNVYSHPTLLYRKERLS